MLNGSSADQTSNSPRSPSESSQAPVSARMSCMYRASRRPWKADWSSRTCRRRVSPSRADMMTSPNIGMTNLYSSGMDSVRSTSR